MSIKRLPPGRASGRASARSRTVTDADERFAMPLRVRYLEVDQQGVVFNMWYLAYFEDARNAFLAAGGLPIPKLVESGCDLQVVHTEIDWHGSLRWTDTPTVAVRVLHIGSTSFTLEFDVGADGTSVVQGRTVYVTIDRDGAKQPIPDELRTVLADCAPAVSAR